MILTIRRHWLFGCLLVAGLALRMLAQLAYQPALVYIDSGRYLFGVGDQDPLGYRALLWPLQRAGGLPAVAAIQHLLGLAMAVTLYAILRRRGLCRWAAAPAAAPVLLDSYQLQAEQTIMPDVLFEALLVAGLACLLCRSRPAPWLAGLAGLLFGMAVDVRQVGEALVVLVPALLLVCGPGWRRRLACAGLALAGFALPVLAYMTGQYTATGSFAVTQRGPDMLYGRAAAAADCATLRLPADERPLCPPRQEVAELGIDGMLGEHGGPLLAYRPPPGHTTRAMAGQFAAAVLRQQPLAVTLAVAHDFVKLFALTRDGSPGDPPISRWQFQLRYPNYPPLVTRYGVTELRPGGGPPRVVRPLAGVLRGYQLHGGFTPGPVLSLALMAALASLCTLGDAPAGRLSQGAASLLVLATVLPVLLVSDSYEFSWRYQLPGVILLPVAGAFGLAALTARFRAELAARRRPILGEAIAAPVTADNWLTARKPAIRRLR